MSQKYVGLNVFLFPSRIYVIPCCILGDIVFIKIEKFSSLIKKHNVCNYMRIIIAILLHE